MLNLLDYLREPSWKLSRGVVFDENGYPVEVRAITWPRKLLERCDPEFLKTQETIRDFAVQLKAQENIVNYGSVSELEIEDFSCIGVYNHPAVILDFRRNPKLLGSIVMQRVPFENQFERWWSYNIYYVSDRLSPYDGYPFLYTGELLLVNATEEGYSYSLDCNMLGVRGDNGKHRVKDLSRVLTCQDILYISNPDKTIEEVPVLTEISYWKPGMADRSQKPSINLQNSTERYITGPILEPVPVPV